MTSSRGSVIGIGLVGPLPPPSGGMANQTRQLARLLQEVGCGVEVVQVNAPYSPPWIEHVHVIRAIFRFVPYVMKLWRIAGRVDLFHVMANSGWAWHLFAAPAVWIAAWRNTPVIINYRGGEAPVFFERHFHWVRPTLKRSALILVPSAFLEQVFRQWGVETVVVPNIVDLGKFHPVELPSAPPHIIVTRNLEDLYDISTAIRAFAHIRVAFPDARMTIAGSGPRRSQLEDLCHALDLSQAVSFTGRVDNEQIAALYQRAQLMLNPSLVDNFPISILEAMASGVAIVTTNIGGIPYLVRDGVTGLLVPPGDHEAMAAAALRLLKDGELADRFRRSALAEVEQYTWKQVRSRLFEAYGRALGLDLRAYCAD
jgi:glycosyltransferase involved in cell wall biosynthesis